MCGIFGRLFCSLDVGYVLYTNEGAVMILEDIRVDFKKWWYISDGLSSACSRGRHREEAYALLIHGRKYIRRV